jgi:hypothetical protein
MLLDGQVARRSMRPFRPLSDASMNCFCCPAEQAVQCVQMSSTAEVYLPVGLLHWALARAA